MGGGGRRQRKLNNTNGTPMDSVIRTHPFIRKIHISNYSKLFTVGYMVL